MLIRSLNSLDKSSQNSFISTAVASNASTIPVYNISGAFANWAIQVGQTGQEQSEVKVLGASAPSGTTLITTAGLTYEHPADTPVYFTKFDQLIFKRSTAGTAGTATAMTGGTVTITPDSTETVFDDTTGAAAYAYKVSYRNSVTGDVSSDSDWLTQAGFSFYSKAKIRERIKGKLFDSGFIKDEVIDDYINEWLEIMNNAAIKVNKDYLLGTVDVAFSGTATLGTITAADFKEIRRLDFTNDGSSWFMSTKKDSTDFSMNQTYNASHPYHYFQGDNIIGRLPATESGTARIVYYKLYPVLDDETDELPVSMHGYTKSFVDWGVAQSLWKDGKDQRAEKRESAAYGERDRFVSEITPRSATGIVDIQMIEPMGGDDY